jgi:hypothetical protein
MFDFVFITHKMTRLEAEKLLEIIKTFVEGCRGEMAGGFSETNDKDQEELAAAFFAETSPDEQRVFLDETKIESASIG